MQFAKPENIIYLILILTLCCIFFIYIYIRKKDLISLGDYNLLKKVFQNISPKYRTIQFILIITGILLSVIALMRPKWGREYVQFKERGAEVMIILDNSLSMLTEDINNFPNQNRKIYNRFDLAKSLISKTIDKLNNAKIGLTLVSRLAQIEYPPSYNHELLKSRYLKYVAIAPQRHQGTQISQAIENCIPIFSEGNHFPKWIILFSDGEDHYQHRFDSVLKKAKQNNILILAVGIGTKRGGYIPLRDEYGNIVGFKTDWYGNRVISQLNENLMLKMAKETKGNYYFAGSKLLLQNLFNNLSSIKLGEINESNTLMLKDHFQIFIFLSLTFILLGIFLPRSSNIIESLSNSRKYFILPLITILLFSFTQPQKNNLDSQSIIREDMNFSNDLMKNGIKSYQQRDFKKAYKDFESALMYTSKKNRRSDLLYNMAKSAIEMNQINKALNLLKMSLKENPNNNIARELYYQLKKNQKKKSQQNQGKSKSKNRNSKNNNKNKGKINNKSENQNSNSPFPFDMNPFMNQDQNTENHQKGEHQQNKSGSHKGNIGDEKLDRLFKKDQMNRHDWKSLSKGQRKYILRAERDW